MSLHQSMNRASGCGVSARRAVASAAVFALEALDRRCLLSAGVLDPTFGAGGKVIDNTLPTVTAMAVQADGKVVEAGMILGNFELARFNADGSADTGFGFMGRLVTDLGGADKPNDIAIQADGKIIVGGDSGNGFGTARYLANGQLDNTFGTGGIVTTSLPGVAHATAVAIRTDGKIIVSGIDGASGPSGASTIALVRYNADGSLDGTFGTGGESLPGGLIFQSTITDMALQGDNKIIVTGYAFSGLSVSPIIRRFTADGAADGTGFAPVNLGGGAGFIFFNAVTVQGDNRIVVAGNSNGSTLLARYNADGSLDPGFNGTGFVTEPSLPGYDEMAYRDVYVQGNGGIVAGGSASRNNAAHQSDFLVDRYIANGTLDTGFGTAGRTVTDFGQSEFANKIAPGPGGTTVLAGGSPTQLDLARYTTDAPVPIGEAPFGLLPISLPGRIEAENFNVGPEGNAYHSSNPINYTNNLYRASGVTIENSGDAGGGFNIGYLHGGDYLRYFVDVTTGGTDTITARVANPAAGGAFHVEVDGVNVAGGLAIPVTASWQTYENVTSPAFALAGGVHVVQLVMDANNAFGFAGNFNYLDVNPAAGGAGSVSGSVYQDLNGNGQRDPGEGGSTLQQVYVDIPGIGHYVAGDPMTRSDINGNYTIGGLPAANYLIRITPPPGSAQTQPGAIFAYQYYIQLGSGMNILGKDFGLA